MTGMLRGRRGRAGRVVAVAVGSALLLSGCSGLTPGTASVVDGRKISMDQVDDLVTAQCAAADQAAKAGQAQPLPTADLGRRSLGLLIDTRLSEAYADSRDVQPSEQLTQLIYGQFQQSIEALPAAAAETLGDAFEDWARARSALIVAAGEDAGVTPSAQNAEQLLNAGVQARDKWASSVDVETDPRFSPGENGLPGEGDGSVSRAVSGFAKSSTAAEVDPSWVATLPQSQKCG